MQLLKNHVSPETAYVVDDYPYGFRLRCKIRYWLEYNSKHGFRFVSQTTNPKRPGEVWNKPKASTYAAIAAAMYLDDVGHVHWIGLGAYSDAAEADRFIALYGEAVPEAGKTTLATWQRMKHAYEARKAQGVTTLAERRDNP